MIATAMVMPHGARADAETDRKLAAVLYQDAKDLIAKGDYEAACPKLEESFRLDRSATGTLMNLAVCHERTHKTATAWAEFGEVVARSRLDGRQDRLDYAQKRADELLPLLSQLVLDVPAAARAAGLSVRLDGAEIASVVWGSAMKIDPGRHLVAAEAGGKVPWSAEVDIAEHESRTVTVPPLADAPPAADVAVPPPASPRADDSRRTLGYATAALGAGALLFGGTFGVLAISANGRADDACQVTGGGTCTTAAGASRARDLQHQATFDANVANVAIGVGLVAAAAGVVLLLTAPKSVPNGASLSKGTSVRGWTLGSAF